jgi:hypothetical protein
MSTTPQQAAFEAAIARLPRWIFGLAIVGTAVTAPFLGVRAAGGFLLGSIGAWINLRLIERVVDRISRQALSSEPGRVHPRRAGFGLLIRFIALILVAFVIIRYSGFSIGAVFCGFLVCPAAAILEIVFELVKYDHT